METLLHQYRHAIFPKSSVHSLAQLLSTTLLFEFQGLTLETVRKAAFVLWRYMSIHICVYIIKSEIMFLIRNRTLMRIRILIRNKIFKFVL
jgi:hypothetical protein